MEGLNSFTGRYRHKINPGNSFDMFYKILLSHKHSKYIA